MTTERGSFEDPGIDRVASPRQDEVTAPGPARSGAGDTTVGGATTRPRGGSSHRSSSDKSGDRLASAAGGVAEHAGEIAQQKLGGQVDMGLDRASDMLDQVADAVRRSGDQLRDDQPQVAQAADMAARQVDRLSGHLRQTDLNGVVSEAEQFARRQPALFLGGALAIGLIASRFLKATPGNGTSSGRADGRFGPDDDGQPWRSRLDDAGYGMPSGRLGTPPVSTGSYPTGAGNPAGAGRTSPPAIRPGGPPVAPGAPRPPQAPWNTGTEEEHGWR